MPITVTGQTEFRSRAKTALHSAIEKVELLIIIFKDEGVLPRTLQYYFHEG
jgi:hypothetical protein